MPSFPFVPEPLLAFLGLGFRVLFIWFVFFCVDETGLLGRFIEELPSKEGMEVLRIDALNAVRVVSG